jgi:hypothetical protein
MSCIWIYDTDAGLGIETQMTNTNYQAKNFFLRVIHISPFLEFGSSDSRIITPALARKLILPMTATFSGKVVAAPTLKMQIIFSFNTNFHKPG